MAALFFKILPARKGDFSGINYNEKKTEQGKAEKIKAINFGTDEPTKEQVIQLLKLQSSLNKRVKLPAFHATMSCKGNQYTHEELMHYAEDMMKQLGYSDQPIIMYAHKDTANNHIHIVTTRVNRKGKKINDSFERQRANHILNAMMNRNPRMEFEANFHEARQFNVSTVAQFNLLVEAAGYKISKNKETNEFIYYKNGEEQGKISEDLINKHISEMQAQRSVEQNNADEKRKKQIAAIIKKYAKQFDTTFAKSTFAGGAYADEKSKFHSELTDELKKKFGLEFVIFSGKDNAKPYGYSIIDHSHKSVYKGSEIMKLNELTFLHKKENTQNNDVARVSEYYSDGEKNFTLQQKNEKKYLPNNHQLEEMQIEQGFQEYNRDRNLTSLIDEIAHANENQNSKFVKQDDGTYKPEDDNKKKRIKYW